MVHEEVEQVDGQVASRGAQLVAITEDGEQVSKVASHSDLRRMSMVCRQLQLLGTDNVGIKEISPEMFRVQNPPPK